MITQYEGNGFRMDFTNGYSISVLWSSTRLRVASDNESGSSTSTLVEVGVFPTGTLHWVKPDCLLNAERCDNPFEWVKIDQLGKLIAWTQALEKRTP